MTETKTTKILRLETGKRYKNGHGDVVEISPAAPPGQLFKGRNLDKNEFDYYYPDGRWSVVLITDNDLIEEATNVVSI